METLGASIGLPYVSVKKCSFFLVNAEHPHRTKMMCSSQSLQITPNCKVALSELIGKFKGIKILNLEVCISFQVPLKIIKVLCVPVFLKRLFETSKRLKGSGALEARLELQTPV